MVTVAEFRRIALGLADTVESAHMGHPDFRRGGRIFASLQPERGRGVVKLTPEQQARAVEDDPGTIVPQPGAWGRQGWTAIELNAADAERAGELLTQAWQNLGAMAAPGRRATRPRGQRSAGPQSASRRRTP